MLRLNRTRAIGAVCMVIFFYYLIFTDSSSTTSTFRASTEAGLARERSKQQHYSPLRGDLSDQDLTAKTQRELDAILGEHLASTDGSEHGSIEADVVKGGDAYLETKHGRQTTRKGKVGSADGVSKEEEKLFDSSSSDVDVDEDDETEMVAVAGRKTMPKPKYPVHSDKEKTLQNDDDDDDDAETAKDRTEEDGSGADTAKDIAREKLQEYLKHPSMFLSPPPLLNLT